MPIPKCLLSFYTLTFSAFLITLAPPMFAAEIVKGTTLTNQVAQQLNEQNTISSIPKEEKHRKALGLEAENALSVKKSATDRSGNLHTRYQQTFKNIPVWGHEIIMHEDNQGRLRGISGNLVKSISHDLPSSPSLLPKYTSVDALHFAKQVYSINTNITTDASLYENEKSELVIYIDDTQTAQLVYYVNFYTDSTAGGQPARPYFLIDAQSLTIIKQWEGLTHAKVGTGPGGNTKTGSYEYGTDLDNLDVSVSGSTCTMSNTNVKSVNLNHGTSGSTAYSYTCYRNTFKQINGAFSPINDAHYFGGVVYDMYSDWSDTAPLSFQLTMRVHYSVNYQNAFWNGSSMTFGDGYSTFYPFVSLDLSAHEVSHGFTEQNSGLIYSGQSGGINEAFSDMAGEAAEFFLHGSNDWRVGADIYKAAGAALRYMNNPPADGVSIYHADDYYDGLDVHYSSGVFNKAFYLLATTSGWDTRKAFDVMVRANQNYWTPSTDFVAGACGAINAANDSYYDFMDVHAAFTAVGVECGTLPRPALAWLSAVLHLILN